MNYKDIMYLQIHGQLPMIRKIKIKTDINYVINNHRQSVHFKFLNNRDKQVFCRKLNYNRYPGWTIADDANSKDLTINCRTYYNVVLLNQRVKSLRDQFEIINHVNL